MSVRYIEEEKLRGVYSTIDTRNLVYDPYNRMFIMNENVEVKKEDEIEAEVEVIEEKSTMALAKPFEPQRHLLRNGKDKRFIKKVEKELKLDAKLGLHVVSENTANKALIHDIDKLTSSKDYYPITKKQLRQLFKIKQLNFMYCLPYNVIEKGKAITEIFFDTVMCQMWSIFSIISAITAVLFLQNYGGVFSLVSILISAAASMTFTTLWFITAFNVRYGQSSMSKDINTDNDYSDDMTSRKLKEELREELYKLRNQKQKRVIHFTSIKVELDLRPLKQTDIDIPYGAKLKAEEAFDSKIFEALVIAHPKFTVQKNSIEIKEKIIPKIDLDPAILGMTADNRLFMIVYWDVKKDIEKTAQKIKKFRKFKLET